MQAHLAASGADGWQQVGGIFRQQQQVRIFRRLFQYFQQRVGGLAHKFCRWEDVDFAFALCRRPLHVVDQRAHLAYLDQHLRRVWRYHQHIWMGLDQDAGIFAVGIAQVFPHLDCLRDARVQVECGGDPSAVVANVARIRQSIECLWIEAIQRLRQRDCQRIFARAARSREQNGMR